jgi:hypothetical protein
MSDPNSKEKTNGMQFFSIAFCINGMLTGFLLRYWLENPDAAN